AGSLTSLLGRRSRDCLGPMARRPRRPRPQEWSSAWWVLGRGAAFQFEGQGHCAHAVTFPVPSTLCKTGADPHPQRARKGTFGSAPCARPAADGTCCPFCFIWMEE